MSLWFVRLCGVLIIVRSLTNFAKLFQGEAAELVFFGQILRGADAYVPAAVVGAFMLVTGAAMLVRVRWAFPLIALYAAYVAVNLLAWTITNPGELERVGARFVESSDPAHLSRVGAAAFLGYCLVALGTTAVPAWLLHRKRQQRS